MLGWGSEWRVFHFTPNKRRRKERTSEVGIDLRGLLTPLSGKTVVIAAKRAHSGPLSSVLLARQGTFYPLICLCDKDNVLSVNLDLEDVCFVFLFPLINQADLKCGNTSRTDAWGVLYLFLLWHLLMAAVCLTQTAAVFGRQCIIITIESWAIVKQWWTLWELPNISNVSVCPLVVCCRKAYMSSPQWLKGTRHWKCV